MVTTAELTEKYISEHPSIKDGLKAGIVNYSRLARRIASELGIEKKTSMEAILIACRRYAERISEENLHEERIISILKKSELLIKNKIVIAVADKNVYSEKLIDVEKKAWKNADTFYVIEGTGSFTFIYSERLHEEIESHFKRNIKNVTKGLAMITIKSPEEIEVTPGVMSYVFSIFGEHGINISQTMSCWTDTIFVIKEEDIPRVMEFLRF